ncbi:MAG: dipeptidase [Sulfolobales archaeon]
MYKIIDLHEDIAYFFETGSKELIRDFDKDISGRHGDIPKYLRGNVHLIFASIFPAIETWDPVRAEKLTKLYGREIFYRGSVFAGYDNLFEQVKIYYRLADKYSDYIEIIFSRSDLDKFLGDNKIRLLISLEGADPLMNPDDLLILYRIGVRSLAITWNYNNRYGASCMSKKDYGLTDAGEELVEYANKLGIILDISHASKKTSLDVINISKLPVIASHSNYFSRKNHPRNIDDEILEGLKRIGGVVGFTLIRSTLGGKESIDDLVDHIVDVWSRYGSDVLAIGTDFFGIENTPTGLEDVSKLQDLLKKLSNRGLGENDLRKIAHENVLRILKIHASKWI